MTRSYLFVPADNRRKLSKAADVDADALILDLEDSVAAPSRAAAREQAADFLRGRDHTWVRINPIDTDAARADLASVMPAAPAGIVLPKPRSAADVVQLAAALDLLEAEHGLVTGQTRIMAICTERPEALFTLHGYVGANARLAALSWGAEDLSTALGASASRDHDGQWLPTYAMARSLALCAAAAAGVAAVDTVFTDYNDSAGLSRYATNARRDGFSGMLAIHPSQVDIINRAFLPTSAEIEHAERVVALFAANPGAGTLGLDGTMLDRPHLQHAERLLQLARKLTAS
ncbi:MAG: CoA ester lyase [Gammaproteobacteria bacterium]|nr:CoA ester lyase [Gammaproteobacteria bacterium]